MEGCSKRINASRDIGLGDRAGGLQSRAIECEA